MTSQQLDFTVKCNECGWRLEVSDMYEGDIAVRIHEEEEHDGEPIRWIRANEPS